MSEAETIKELMVAYDEKRTEWINGHGSDRGFDRWFTEQVCKPDKLPEEVVMILKMAVEYLEHPEVRKIPFALSSLAFAQRIRDILEAQR